MLHARLFASRPGTTRHIYRSFSQKKDRIAIDIEKEDVKFSAAHFTIFSATERENLHGHNYRVTAKLVGHLDSTVGMLQGLDYNFFKKILRKLVTELDERTLLPLYSPFLKITEGNGFIEAKFGKEETAMRFHTQEVVLLPIINVTGEELSRYLMDKLQKELKNSTKASNGLLEATIGVSSGPGQTVSLTRKLASDHPCASEFVQEAVSGAQGVADNRILIVTGGSSGIGQAVVRRFLKDNRFSRVYNMSRRECPVNDARVINFKVDLLKTDLLQSTLSQLREKYAEKSLPVCLVHASASHPTDSIQNLSPDTLQQTMQLNVVAPALITNGLLPIMAEESSILYIGSTLSRKAIANRLSYCTSKSALIGLMRATAQDLFGKKIHTALICPGFTNTEMLQTAMGNNQAEFHAFIKNFVSFGRLIEPEEIAELTYQTAQLPILNGSILDANLGQKET